VPFPYAGEACALLAPLCWSIAILFYRRSSELASPMAMTLFKNSFAVVLLAFTLLALGEGLPRDRSLPDWLRLVVSGVLGLAVADMCLFEALRRIGAARFAVVDTVYAPTVVTLSVLLLGEELSVGLVLGGALVVTGVAVANSRLDQRVDADGGSPVVGLLFGLGAIFGTAVGVILAKPVLERSGLVEVTFTRLVAGVLGQLAFVAVRGGAAEAFQAMRPSKVWWTLVPASVLGTTLSLLFWLGGFKWANASVAAVLNQLATVYLLVLARVFLGETLTRRQVGGAAIAVGGAAVVVAARLVS
jgi:drug/metabolite transporter (DMT)-like permease